MTTPAHRTGRTAHTPGPWFVSGVRFKMNGSEWHAVNRYDEDKKQDTNIACVGYDPRTGDGLAEARLIAAAPELQKALEDLVNAKALQGVRQQVAGWNGEGRDTGPFERHPPRLGATLPKTDCGAIYELDDAMQAARAALSATRSTGGA